MNYPNFPTTRTALKKANCSNNMERLQKILAKAGVASRRKAELLIQEGRVQVDGTTITEMGFQVKKGSVVTFDGKRLAGENKVYFVINKPKKVLSTVNDDRGRPSVIDLVESTERIYPVGRLDYESTGVLILTNDGEFAHELTHPRFHLKKVYEVRVKGVMSTTQIKQMEQGILLDGIMTLPAKVVVTHKDFEKSLTEFKITLVEGKNRQIRRMAEALGLSVVRLHRAKFGIVDVKDLPAGQYRRLKPMEVKQLRQLSNEGTVSD